MTGAVGLSRGDAAVDRVIRSLGRLDPALEQAIRQTPRDIFLSAELAAMDADPGRRLSREGRMVPPPEVSARMIEALHPGPDSKVLEVGCGVGYATAVLSRVAGQVYAVEWIDVLAEAARRMMAALGVTNARIETGPPDSAWAEEGPFDAILVSARDVLIPASLRRRLTVGGRMVLAHGPNRSRQTLVRVTRRAGEDFLEERLGEMRFGRRLGDILVDSGAVERSAVERLSGEAASRRRRVGEQLVKEGGVSEEDVYRALAVQRWIPFGTVDSVIPRLDLEAVRSVPRSFLQHHQIVPVERGDERLVLATCDPDLLVSDLAKVFHPRVPEPLLVTPTDYRRIWSAVDLMASGRPVAVAAGRGGEDLGAGSEQRLEARYVGLFESLLLDAIGARGSDIHLERYGDRVRVRIRVDGDLRDVPRYRMTPDDLLGIVNVVKIRANLDIAERRLPQGGRIRVKTDGKAFDLRVQTQPSLHGEHVVIRLLPQDVKLLSVEDLGFPPRVAVEYRRLLDHPSGLVLSVGPTGSGKTTTLYAGLQLLSQDVTRKVITVEDPIEYAIENIQQTQVRPEIGFPFAEAMRSFVRQDPDVILVGEIRDHETALEAIRASQTGHLVLSTLHCNDTTDAVQRLVDLGMHPNSIASELLAVMSQRLAKRICEGCRTEGKPDAELERAVFPGGPPPGWRHGRGAGCSRCGGHGTYGRIACVEFLRTNAALRLAVSRHPPVDEFRRLSLEAGLLTLRDAAVDLVGQGLIALPELPAMMPLERLAPERSA